MFCLINITGVDLVITGSNVTKHKPAVFSSRHTPLFPVAGAVGISMNLPILFKPVHVEANVPADPLNSRADDYHGMWIDGGVLNNFPLHAFDHWYFRNINFPGYGLIFLKVFV